MTKDHFNVQFNVSPKLRREINEIDGDVYSIESSSSSIENQKGSRRKRSSISWLDFQVKKPNSGANELKSKIHGCVAKRKEKITLKDLFFSTFPLFAVLRNYSLKNDLLTDIAAGFTVSILHIPQAIAYSFLIGIGPIYGLYSSFFPVLIYAFMGTAQHISIGTIAVVDIMLAEIVKRYNFDGMSSNFPTNSTDIHVIKLSAEELSTDGPHNAVELMTSVCLLTGLLQLAMGFLKMGAVSLIFSDQLVSGFSCAAAFHVIVSQLPSVFDITIAKGGNRPFHLVIEIISIVKHTTETNYTSLIISSVILLITILFKEFMEPCIKHRYFTVPLPIDLIIVFATTILSKYCRLHRQFSVSIMGNIPIGFPTPKMPRISYASSIILDAISVAVITYAFALSLGKIYAKKHRYTIKPNQEFIALGTANAVSAFFGCFATTASLARTSTMGNHAKTQVSSIVSCTIILFVLLYFAPGLYYLPKCAIGVIICYAQKPLILQICDFYKSWKLSRYEGLISIVTFVSVLLLGIDLGLFAGVVFSVLTIVLRFYSPKLRLLGQLPYTEIYLDIRQHPATREIFGFKILQFSSPLFFMNKDFFQESVYNKTCTSQKFKGFPQKGQVEAVVIDCSSMSFVDTSGVEALIEISNEMCQRSIEVALAACPPPVISMLTRSEFFVRSPNTALFPSVHEAVTKVVTPSLAKKIVDILP